MSQSEYESLDVSERLRKRQEQNRFEYDLKQFINDEFQKRREWFVVTYEGYDADQGQHRVKMQDGSIIYAQAQSIPGSVGRGSTLIAFCPSGSNHTRLLMPL